MKTITKLIFGLSAIVAQVTYAHGPKPFSLQNVPIPSVPGLLDGSSPIVVDKNMAIALGKALFWDTNVGSDGMACGSCHFHAGADGRTKNQINPGEKSSLANGLTFDTLESGAGGPNHKLTLADFPLQAYNNPLNKTSGVKFSTDDVVASAGTFSGDFKGVPQLTGSDDVCDRSADPIYHVGNTGTRRVEPRNAPSVINSVFNFRNFWDGRANNIFNGSSPWGDRDPNAGIWVQTSPRTVEKQRLHLENASLASLSVAPPLNASEMSCRGRNLAALGRKLLTRKPLQYQAVHPQDSVFGPLNLTLSTASALKPGLNTTYKTMVTKAFNSKYWSYSALGPFGAPAANQIPYNQVEANFSMFFGIALQMYQSTLVSDQAPIDITPRDPATYAPTWQGMGKSAAEIASINNGLSQFTDANHCGVCHAGPTLTSASIATNSMLVTPTPGKFYGPALYPRAYGSSALGAPDAGEYSGISRFKNVMVRDDTTVGSRLMDVGFANTSVGNSDSDPGIAGFDDFGNPLSFSEQYLTYLLGNPTNKPLDPGVTTVQVCNFNPEVPFAANVPDVFDYMFTAADGLIPDGSREGVLRDQNCYASDDDLFYIPTPEAAAANLNTKKMAIATKAVFKIPSLRNVELTGPYMHNGSMATLEQVVEFYSRHGNFENPYKHNLVNLISLGTPGDQYVSEATRAKNRADVVAFLKTLTDDRVRYEKAPFDHPEIKVPHGHVGNDLIATPGNPLNPALAKDEYLVVPAVGANGDVAPLLPFSQLLTQ